MELPYNGNPVVGEVANMKQRKLWKMGNWAVSPQQCHPNSAGSLVIARRTEWNIVLLFLCCWLPPKLGETAKVYRIDCYEIFLWLLLYCHWAVHIVVS